MTERLLCIVGTMDAGGAETFLMKIYRKLDKTIYQMDFCVASPSKGLYEDEIRKMGGKIFRITPKTKGILKNYEEIKKIVKNNHYKNVLRVSQNSASSIELLASKLGGADNTIFRSSNSKTYGKTKSKIIHYIFKPLVNIISDHKIAPSKEAGDFMFGKNNYEILNNGIPIEQYRFSNKYRSKYRKELGVKNNEIVIGHVGRFNEQKNHKYLIDIFVKYHNTNKNSVLWLIGKGELENEIRKYAKDKKIIENIKFLGIRKDVNRLYSAMDYFIFPSLYEGMPNVIIEAQASGLRCIVSSTITKKCKITNKVDFCNLENNDDWIKKIGSSNYDRTETIPDEYDINNVVKKFIDIAYKKRTEQ